ncbi:MAG: SAM-dependent methyltransferase [Campylobacteraceae bacterium]|jgi:type I restriction-modification system DNA methylase subunit|nr:SAM-dependent methyltransferase [Campylobacteraceae bacterium]
MANERITENIVRKLLVDNGYNNDLVKIEEQKSENPKINKLLQHASKSGKGVGKPEFIISFVNKSEDIMIIECKADTTKHESSDRDKYKDYAVDGVLLYASYLKNDFNVTAVAVSGETEREIKISHFLWIKGMSKEKDMNDKHLIPFGSIFSLIDEHIKPIKDNELVKKAIEYNERLHRYSIPEVERCTLISSILVALQSGAFPKTFSTFKHKLTIDNKIDLASDYNPNEHLIDSLLISCESVLNERGLNEQKRKVILGEYGKIKQNHILKSISFKKKHEIIANTLLRDLIDDINKDIMPYVKQNYFDVLGRFYTQFIRYAGSDKKTGLVLTPTHITDLFCELANITSNDIVFDPCCGTGGFLVSAMKHMVKDVGNNLSLQQKIKTEQLIGIERRADMFSHACSNMMMMGDGKSHIHYGDCFDDNLKELVKQEKPNKVFLNPPYDVGEDGQLEFIDNAMDCIVKDGICIAICQMSAAISSNAKTIDLKKRLLSRHTLDAVLSMPDDLFYPVGAVTCIIIFKAHTPHPKGKETFFGYFKNDGFEKRKLKGRIDVNNKWKDIKNKWVNAYGNKKNINGLSVTKEVNYKDEWCAEAYMETDYSVLNQNDFEKTIREYFAYLVKNGIAYED